MAAEKNTTRETEGSWWGGWLESAKAKSASAVEFLKKDLQEFTNVMKEDTTKAAVDVKKQLTQENATAATQKVKEGMSKVLGGITKALVIESEDKGQTRGGRKPSGEHIFDRAKARLRAIQLDPNTYCDEPEGSLQDYNKWLENFVLDSKKGDISELLIANVDVRSLYTQLVPSEVSHADFWHRYFYKLHQLDQDEARKAALMKRADVVQEQLDLEWEDDDWGDIEGPSSPPKPTAGNMHEVMATKCVEKQNHSVSEADHSLQEDEQKTEKDSRVPENGTQYVKSTAVATQEKSLDQTPEMDTIKEAEGESQPTDSDSTSVSQGSNENIHSETNIQESVASGKEEVVIEKETLQPDAAVSNTSPAAQPKRNENETKNSVPDKTSVSSAPSVMEPLSVDTNIKMRDKGDMVVVGSEGTTPSSESTAYTNKESTSIDDDWEKDFDDDVEVTEEDMRLAAEAAKKLAESGAIVDDGDDDWESWD